MKEVGNVKEEKKTKKTQLKKHILEVHGERGYICTDHCGKKFTKKKRLGAHLMRLRRNLDRKNDHIYDYREDISGEFEEGEEGSVIYERNLSLYSNIVE